MKLSLPDDVSSLQDLKAVTAEIREYARWQTHASIKKRAGGGRAAGPPEISPAARAAVRGWAGDDLDKLIEALEDHADKVPRLTITLAAPAPGSLKKTLTAWCRKNVEPGVMVDFRFDSTLLGGMVVRWRSRIFDWSFRSRILEESGRFPEVLRRV
ncbi:MAG TPA: F0F1 ATP synthase subunit delta [Candidatus Saccharimonadales bacterium]|nr:F0F1 ATP synthase subunit delta [Candidatus Saccharimonadales bacterium]